MPRSLLMKAGTGWSIHVAKPPYRCWRSPPFFIRFASRASIRWLRDVDRPPRRSLSNELLIARGTPPNPGGEFLLQAPRPIANLQSRALARVQAGHNGGRYRVGRAAVGMPVAGHAPGGVEFNQQVRDAALVEDPL